MSVLCLCITTGLGLVGYHISSVGTTINGLKYIKLLQEKLSIHMVVHNTSMFILDGTPCHRSKVVSEVFDKKQGGSS